MREAGRIRGVFLRVEGSVMPSPGSNPNRFPEVRVLFEAGDPHWFKGRDVFDGPGRLQTGLHTMFPIPDAPWLMVQGLEIPQFAREEVRLKASGETR